MSEGHINVLLERVAFAHQDDVAVSTLAGGSNVTYKVLFVSARSMADALHQAGASLEELVGMLLTRSPLAIIGLLGAVLAGNAYVPLDPTYPSNRLSQIIECAQIRFVEVELGSTAAIWLEKAWPNVTELGVRVANEDGTMVKSIHTCALPVTKDRLLYVLFTSGSTGQPKAVPGFESGVVKRLKYWWSAFPYASHEATLHHITYNWVDHVMEVWNVLLAGRKLIIIPEVAALLEIVDSPQPECQKLWLVPSVLRIFLDRLGASNMRKGATDPLLHVVITGEPMPSKLLERYQEAVPQGTLINAYGMTEVQGDCSVAIYHPDRALSTPDRVSIGGSILDFTFWLRDIDDGRWVTTQAGQVGELHIMGSIVVPGYYRTTDGSLLADEKAATRFLNTQQLTGNSSMPPGIFFQTGDLVTWRDDNELNHFGRVDDQVKVNGVRTELGDVSAAALACHGVNAAFAICAQDSEDTPRIVLFVISQLDRESLMHSLAEHLPKVYMPTIITYIARLPTLPNGKVDRRALQLLALDKINEGLVYRKKQATEADLSLPSILSIASRICGQPINMSNTLGSHFDSLSIFRFAQEVKQVAPHVHRAMLTNGAVTFEELYEQLCTQTHAQLPDPFPFQGLRCALLLASSAQHFTFMVGCTPPVVSLNMDAPWIMNPFANEVWDVEVLLMISGFFAYSQVDRRIFSLRWLAVSQVYLLYVLSIIAEVWFANVRLTSTNMPSYNVATIACNLLLAQSMPICASRLPPMGKVLGNWFVPAFIFCVHAFGILWRLVPSFPPRKLSSAAWLFLWGSVPCFARNVFEYHFSISRVDAPFMYVTAYYQGILIAFASNYVELESSQRVWLGTLCDVSVPIVAVLHLFPQTAFAWLYAHDFFITFWLFALSRSQSNLASLLSHNTVVNASQGTIAYFLFEHFGSVTFPLIMMRRFPEFEFQWFFWILGVGGVIVWSALLTTCLRCIHVRMGPSSLSLT